MGRRSSIVPIALLALLVILAWLQFRWTGQLSVAERERMMASIQTSVGWFAADLDDEVAALFRQFRLERGTDFEELGPALRERWEHYLDVARYPELVNEIYFVDPDGGLFHLESSDLIGVQWPSELAGLREHLVRRARAERRGRPVPFPVVFGNPPTVALPIGGGPRRWPGFALSGYVLVTLDWTTLENEVFPDLSERHFGDEYDVSVVNARGDILFSTAPEHSPIAGDSDMRGELFSVGRFEGRPPRGERRRHPELDAMRRELGGGWRVFVRHRSGSLEAAVAKARTRNLAISFGILGLLAASMLLVAVSTRRATELNDRKMEFVAGVSHELRTPVAVLRSAGQNLADGSVSDPEQVKRYGALIETEGRRLNDLVEQVLELAGIQSNKRRLSREPVVVSALVESALADVETARKEKNVSITTKLPPGALELTGDADALRRALSNLLLNAIKHGDVNNAIEVAVDARGDMVAMMVSDCGPGIPEEDRKHLFEAFYRGRRARERQVPGSGMGLSLVDHVAREHGGSVSLESTLGKGSRFTLLIPAVEHHANG